MLPRGATPTRRLTGDGVVVGVFAHLARHLIRPLAESGPAPFLPTDAPHPRRRRKEVGADGRIVSARKGIKGATTSIQCYLLPRSADRLKGLARRSMEYPVSELLMRGADALLAQRGQQPLERYVPPPRRMANRGRRAARGGGISVLRRLIILKRPMLSSHLHSRMACLSAMPCCPSRDPSRLSATLAGNPGCSSASSRGRRVLAPLLSRLLGERPPAWAAC